MPSFLGMIGLGTHQKGGTSSGVHMSRSGPPRKRSATAGAGLETLVDRRERVSAVCAVSALENRTGLISHRLRGFPPLGPAGNSDFLSQPDRTNALRSSSVFGASSAPPRASRRMSWREIAVLWFARIQRKI